MEAPYALASRACARWGELADYTIDDLRHLALSSRGRQVDDALIIDGCAIAAAAIDAVLGVRLHEVQLLASSALASGWSVQMCTGEGKTFAAIAPALILGWRGDGVHVMTANPYLAKRDAGWSGNVLRALGLTVAVTTPGMSRAETRAAYAADVTFGAGQDFGFDHLRDQLCLDEPVQRGRNAAVVDEVDAVLLDHGRTPLVLSGATDADSVSIVQADAAVRSLRPDVDIDVDRTTMHVELTDDGVTACERLLGIDGLYDPMEICWPHYLANALRARVLLHRDHDYIVRGGRILPVDDVTGRSSSDRRWSDGVHQAIEAKEGLAVTSARRALGRTSMATYLADYTTVVGMSGTLEDAADELSQSHGLRMVVVPTHHTIVRADRQDASFDDVASRDVHVVADVVERNRRGQPVLVGTTSIAQAQHISTQLRGAGIEPKVLTARNDDEEAHLIAAAGRSGAVTVANQMAGRGVDIILDDSARAAGGLMVWGIEHHPSRRRDEQLRGRSGRQGDPGESQFATTPDDDLSELGPDGQRRAELLDWQLRAEDRAFEDHLWSAHADVHKWRRSLRDDPTALSREVEMAVAATVASVARRRRRQHESELRARLDERRRALGANWDEVGTLVLERLLLLLWSDVLVGADGVQSTVRALSNSYSAATDLRVGIARLTWQFAATVRTDLIAHLLGAEILTGPPPGDGERQSECEVAAAPIAAWDRATRDALRPVTSAREWTGWSFNNWARRTFGTSHLLDLPVVLALDAIGDTANSERASVVLDLAEPTRSTITLH